MDPLTLADAKVKAAEVADAIPKRNVPAIELVSPLPDEQLLAVNEALDRYAQHYPTQADVITFSRALALQGNPECLSALSMPCLLRVGASEIPWPNHRPYHTY